MNEILNQISELISKSKDPRMAAMGALNYLTGVAVDVGWTPAQMETWSALGQMLKSVVKVDDDAFSLKDVETMNGEAIDVWINRKGFYIMISANRGEKRFVIGMDSVHALVEALSDADCIASSIFQKQAPPAPPF